MRKSGYDKVFFFLPLLVVLPIFQALQRYPQELNVQQVEGILFPTHSISLDGVGEMVEQNGHWTGGNHKQFVRFQEFPYEKEIRKQRDLRRFRIILEFISQERFVKVALLQGVQQRIKAQRTVGGEKGKHFLLLGLGILPVVFQGHLR